MHTDIFIPKLIDLYLEKAEFQQTGTLRPLYYIKYLNDLITESNIKYGHRSDHSFTELKIQLNKFQRGPGIHQNLILTY